MGPFCSVEEVLKDGLGLLEITLGPNSLAVRLEYWPLVKPASAVWLGSQPFSFASCFEPITLDFKTPPTLGLALAPLDPSLMVMDPALEFPKENLVAGYGFLQSHVSSRNLALPCLAAPFDDYDRFLFPSHSRALLLISFFCFPPCVLQILLLCFPREKPPLPMVGFPSPYRRRLLLSFHPYQDYDP